MAAEFPLRLNTGLETSALIPWLMSVEVTIPAILESWDNLLDMLQRYTDLIPMLIMDTDLGLASFFRLLISLKQVGWIKPQAIFLCGNKVVWLITKTALRLITQMQQAAEIILAVFFSDYLKDNYG